MVRSAVIKIDKNTLENLGLKFLIPNCVGEVLVWHIAGVDLFDALESEVASNFGEPPENMMHIFYEDIEKYANTFILNRWNDDNADKDK